jgi:hypothetical protein
MPNAEHQFADIAQIAFFAGSAVSLFAVFLFDRTARFAGLENVEDVARLRVLVHSVGVVRLHVASLRL